MTTVEEIQGTILIAEFMGVKKETLNNLYDSCGNKYSKTGYVFPDEYKFAKKKKFTFRTLQKEEQIEVAIYGDYELMFNMKWEWLMGIVQEINRTNFEDAVENKMYEITIGSDWCKIKGKQTGEIIVHNHDSFNNLINVVFKTVVDFIKMYNDEKLK